MIKPKWWLMMIGLLLFVSLTAQDLSFAGPVSNGLANIRSAPINHWNTFANTANNALIKEFSLGAAYQMPYAITELSNRALSLTLPTSLGSFSGGVLQSGTINSMFTRYGLSYSRLFGESLAAGFQFNYLSHQTVGYESGNGFYSSVGLHFRPTSMLEINALVINPEQGKLYYHDLAFPIETAFISSVAWHSTARFRLLLEAQKTIERPLQMRVATELNFANRLFIRCGVQGQPTLYSFGGGFVMNRLQIDAGFLYHQQLGITSSAGLSYAFKPRKP